MPLGIERINAKKSQPNPLIVFIKPLKGPDEAVAQDFLERIAAQCLPIMKQNHLTVMSLEEYEPNREFVGRNFNAGEVVQLVLKSPSTGRWLPFHYVQMVMMHELAHCKQMNHSKAFWAVRNNYADQMRTLWCKNYTGEGLWGRGTLLKTGEFETNKVRPDEVLPEHLCGGTYRSRRRKRKAKDELTYQEKKQRRILKKFGANGVALGEDEEVKAELEKGKKTQSKPRVARSKRGRELRAAAALARFDQQKKSQEDERTIKVESTDPAGEMESETASESESEDEATEATGIDGKQLLDRKGKRMVRVCEDENPEDEDARNELQELQFSMNQAQRPKPGSSSSLETLTTKPKRQDITELVTKKVKDETTQSSKGDEAVTPPPPGAVVENHGGICPLCSFDNGPVCLTCGVCSHVLHADKDPNSWRCNSAACDGSRYLNAGDSGACGVCGERKRIH